MAVTSGFFNSKNHDRLYDATQFSSFFDGLITDGVYQSIGDAFMVNAYPDGNSAVLVGTGRAWFNKTWTVNDTLMFLDLDPPSTLLDRIYAIFLDINRSEAVRKNSIIVVKGEYSESPKRPTLIHNDTHDQYPLAYVQIAHGDDAPIEQRYISNMVGTKECPLVAGFLESMDITMFIAQMEDKFNNWFEDLETNLSGDVAANLQNQINQLEEDVAEAAQGAISLDTLEKAKNVSITVSSIPRPSNGGHGDPTYHSYAYDMLLPDGYVIDVVLNNMELGGECDLAVRLMDPSGVKRSEITVESGTFTEDRNLSIISVTDSYPYQLVLSSYIPTSATSNTSFDDRNPNGTVTIKCSVYTITVSATHVMTSSISTKSLKATKLDINNINNVITESAVSLRPGVLDDGSYVLCAPVGANLGSTNAGLCNLIYRITSDFLVDKLTGVTDWAFGSVNYNNWSPIGHGFFTSDAKDVNRRIALSSSGSSKTVLLNPSDGSVASETTGVYESDLASIPVDGVGRIVANATSIGVYDHKTTPTSTIPIPLSTELSWSLDGTAAFNSWKSGVMDENGRILLIGNGSQIRAGIIPDNGLMIWASPVSGSVFTSSSDTKFSLILPPKASWVTNDDGTVHYILLRGGAELTLKAGNRCPIQAGMNWTDKTSKIVKVDLGDW